jgi:hypothetical protein
MQTLESDHGASWDPAIWSIATLLGAAVFYVACLS